MNITLVELLIAALATWEIVEIWQHSSIMASWRARAELLTGRIGDLLRCGFCLSVWVAWLVTLIVLVPLPPAEGFWDWTGRCIVAGAKLVLVGFAVARLANLGNDLTHAKCRTPHANRVELDAAKDERESNPKSGFENELRDDEFNTGAGY